MNKLGTVLGLAAICAIAGCKDPNYQRRTSKDDVKDVGATAVEQPAEAPVGGEVAVDEAKCTCPPGAVHEEPCGCGAADCQCVVVKKTATSDGKKSVAPVTPVEPAYTIYIVQRGDYLAKISKKYNVTINSIKQLNGLKDDKILLGQKLKLPGKIDVGEQTVPEGAVAKVKANKVEKKTSAAYTGATAEYVVKSGDTLGAIAYGHGINIRQLKELNGLSSDALKIGQKLKVPAGKVEKVEAKKDDVKKVEEKKTEAKEEAQPTVEAPAVDQPAETPAVEAPAESVVGPTHTVQEGEELTDISIRWGVSAAAVRELNNLPEDVKLVPGQVLKLPADAQQ